MLDIEIQLQWRPVLLRDGGRFDWHRRSALYARDREQLLGPQVYRWVLRKADGSQEALYIGETKAFDKRIDSYRKPKAIPSSTEVIVRTEMNNCEEHGGIVDLEFLDLGKEGFKINGKLINKFALGEPDVRRMMESIATIEARRNNVRLINRLEDNANFVEIERLLRSIIQIPDVDSAMELVRNLLNESPSTNL